MAFSGRIRTIRLSSIVDPHRTVFELNRCQISLLPVPPRLEAASGVVTVADRPYIVLGSNMKRPFWRSADVRFQYFLSRRNRK